MMFLSISQGKPAEKFPKTKFLLVLWFYSPAKLWCFFSAEFEAFGTQISVSHFVSSDYLDHILQLRF